MLREITNVDFLVLSILVLYLGNLLTEKIPFLKKNNIPAPVSGGLLFSITIAVLQGVFDVEFSFDMRLRDVLLLVFFTTIGLGATLRMLKAGGRALGMLLLAAAVFLVVQNVTGVGLAVLLDAHPGYGLFGGSISFAGGHGTAIAWGATAEEAGLKDAGTVGIAFATFGLIAGGLLGGPLAGRLMRRWNLTSTSGDGGEKESATVSGGDKGGAPLDLRAVLGTILILAICVQTGDAMNRFVFSRGVLLPGFLTAMLVGIVFTNIADATRVKISMPAVELTGDVALQLFLAMSLMSMDLSSLATAAAPIVFVLFVQMLVIAIFAVFIVFRLMGRNYDAAVIAGGFVGLGLGATPVAIANMDAITKKFGPSPKAFLIVPLVGAFFIDLTNAVVIKFFLGLPIMQQAAG